eukprot:6940667-Karenia_brevis.AAC.1
MMTAVGAVYLKNYSFQFKVWGQYEPIEWLMKMRPNGWQKRVSITVSPGNFKRNEDVQDSTSVGIWVALHDWMFVAAFDTPVYAH